MINGHPLLTTCENPLQPYSFEKRQCMEIKNPCYFAGDFFIHLYFKTTSLYKVHISIINKIYERSGVFKF